MAYTPYILILREAAQASGLKSASIAVHDVDANRSKAGIVASTDLVSDLDPALVIHRSMTKVAANPGSLEDVVAEIPSAFGTLVPPGGDKTRALARLRAAQDAFGPEPGSPYRVVPDAVEGEDPEAILDALPGMAQDRVRHLAAELERHVRACAGIADSDPIRRFVGTLNEAVDKGLRCVVAMTAPSPSQVALYEAHGALILRGGGWEIAEAIRAVRLYLNIPETGSFAPNGFRHPLLHGSVGVSRVDIIENEGSSLLTATFPMLRQA